MDIINIMKTGHKGTRPDYTCQKVNENKGSRACALFVPYQSVGRAGHRIARKF